MRYYFIIFLSILKKTLKNFSKDNQSVGGYLNPGPPQYKE
jgi:hypothetical protein